MQRTQHEFLVTQVSDQLISIAQIYAVTTAGFRMLLGPIQSSNDCLQSCIHQSEFRWRYSTLKYCFEVSSVT